MLLLIFVIDIFFLYKINIVIFRSMIRKFLIFLWILYLLIITVTHWGAGLLLMVRVVAGVLSPIGKSKNWVAIMLRPLRKPFYSPDHSGSVNLIYTIIFFLITTSNLLGLYIYNQHILLTRVVIVLTRLVFLLWIFSYKCFINRGWGYLASNLIINMIYPSLSLLLRNIEILTHLFRPLTLIARIWVNIWVGHCILSMLSFIFIKKVSRGLGSRISLLLLLSIAQRSLILYELIIILLQSTVIVYLSFVYYRENLRSTID